MEQYEEKKQKEREEKKAEEDQLKKEEAHEKKKRELNGLDEEANDDLDAMILAAMDEDEDKDKDEYGDEEGSIRSSQR